MFRHDGLGQAAPAGKHLATSIGMQHRARQQQSYNEHAVHDPVGTWFRKRVPERGHGRGRVSWVQALCSTVHSNALIYIDIAPLAFDDALALGDESERCSAEYVGWDRVHYVLYAVTETLAIGYGSSNLGMRVLGLSIGHPHPDEDPRLSQRPSFSLPSF